MNVVFSRKSLFALVAPIFASLGMLGKRDERLIVEAQSGDHEAFKALQEIHSSALRRFIARRISGPERDDLYQETWLAAWQNLRFFDDRGKFRAWLFTIGYRRIQDFRRREHVRPRISPFSEGESEEYHERDFRRIEIQNALSTFWNACTVDQQEILTLYYSDGMTLAEIAKLTGKNVNTLKYQFYKIHEDALKLIPEGADVLLNREVMA